MRSGVVRAAEVSELGPFAEPKNFTEPLLIDGVATGDLVAMLRTMILIRVAEEEIANEVEAGRIVCPCHLGIGQEAVAVGVSAVLSPADRVFGAHRSHSHYLALGGDVNAMLAEIFGRVTGCSRGMGGSMHLFSPDHGFFGSVPIVAATIPIAVGAAMALQKDRKGGIAVSYFGDGATEEGVFHESLNLAATLKLPILFVCENNLYSSHLDISLRQPCDTVARYAVAHRINGYVVDGNDVLAMREVSTELVTRARKGEGPGFIEAVTYRWRGHVGPNEDIDVGVRRKEGDLGRWKQRDPIGRLKSALVVAGSFTEQDYRTLELGIREEVKHALAQAKAAPFPSSEALLGTVYHTAAG